MMLNFDFDELYYFIKSSTCMSLFEKGLKLIKKSWFGLVWFDFDCLISLAWSEKSLNQLEVGLVWIGFSKKWWFGLVGHP